MALVALILVLVGVERLGDGLSSADEDTAAAAAECTAARNWLGRRLSGVSETCRRSAREALDACSDASGRTELFTRLETLRLPERTGLKVEDRFGRALAWTGAELDPDTPPPLEGVSFVEERGSRRVVVRVTRPAPNETEGAPRVVSAVCHRAVSETGPATGHPGPAYRLTDEVQSRFTVGDVAIEGPDSATGEPVSTADGVVIARVVVTPLSSEMWRTRARARSATRRTALLFIALLIGMSTAWRLGTRLRHMQFGGPARAVLLRAAAIAATWWGLSHLDARTLLGDVPMASSSAYGGDLGSSPVAALVTALALLGLAVALAECVDGLPRRSYRSVVTLIFTIVVAIGLREALGFLVRDVVANSTVAFFPDDRVLPPAAALALIGALFACFTGALILLRTCWRRGDPPKRSRGATILAMTFFGALVAPWSVSAPDALLVVTSALSMGAALAAFTLANSPTVRAAAVPLALSIAVFGPVERQLESSERDRVLARAESPGTRSEYALLRVDDALDQVRGAPELAQALRDRLLPPHLAETLWARTKLPSFEAASGIVLRPRLGYGERQVAGAHLPPSSWLPVTSEEQDDTERPVESRAGRGAGADGRWAVGTLPLSVDGDPAGGLDVLLEWNRPALGRLDALEVLTPPADRTTRGDPQLSASRYDARGRLESTESPYDAAGAPLAPSEVLAALDEPGPVWRHVTAGGQELGLLVRPRVQDDGRRGAEVFAFASRGPRGTWLAAIRTALVGALCAAGALLFSAGSWIRGLRRRIGHRLVVLLVLLAAVPLLALANVAQGLVVSRAESDSESGLRQAVSLTEVALRRAGGDERSTPDGESLRELAYARGHHIGVYAGSDRATLLAASEPGLVDGRLLPAVLPGSVFRSTVLLERPFAMLRHQVGDQRFDVGYAPLRDAEQRVIGAVAVPFPEARRARDRELAAATTLVLGFSLLGLVAAAVLGTWLSGRLIAPLKALSEAADRVARGDLGSPVPPVGADELGQVIQAFNRMIADLDESQRRLVEAEKEAAWRDMARQVAHEVKNPLTPMRLAAQHLARAHADNAPDFDKILERSVAVIVRQTEKLQRIVTDFRDFARLPIVRREPLDVGELLRHVTDLYARVPNLETTLDAAPGLPRVSANPEEFERVLINLVGNAVEALDGRDGALRVRATATVGGVRVVLEDDGPGIAPELLPRIFEPSFSTKTGGTGLGLAICKRAIDDLGGTIAIESDVGTGTKVTIDLPASGDGDTGNRATS